MNLTAILMSGAVLAAFGAGYKVADNVADARQLKILKLEKERYAELESQYHGASADLERVLSARRTQQTHLAQKVAQIVVRPVYSNACFDDDGLRAANAALTNTPYDPSKPDTKMPTTPTP